MKKRNSRRTSREESIDLAIKLSLPCSFHVREAMSDFFSVVKNFPKLKPSVLHSFSDTKENLEYALENGFYIGTNGLITFAKLDCFKQITSDFLDRCILDNYIYAKYLNNKGIVSDKVIKTLKEVLDRTLPAIQYLFFLRPEFEMEQDNERSINKQFQDDIDKMFIEFFEQNKGKYYYRELVGESQKRLEKIKEIITGGYVY